MSIQKILNVTDQLMALLDEEKKYMQAHDRKNVFLLADQKAALSSLYDQALQELKENRLMLKQSPVELINLLESKTQALQAKMKKSEEQISLYHEANTKLLDALIDKCTGEEKKVARYTPFGRKYSDAKNGISPLAIDKYI